MLDLRARCWKRHCARCVRKPQRGCALALADACRSSWTASRCVARKRVAASGTTVLPATYDRPRAVSIPPEPGRRSRRRAPPALSAAGGGARNQRRPSRTTDPDSRLGQVLLHALHQAAFAHASTTCAVMAMIGNREKRSSARIAMVASWPSMSASPGPSTRGRRHGVRIAEHGDRLASGMAMSTCTPTWSSSSTVILVDVVVFRKENARSGKRVCGALRAISRLNRRQRGGNQRGDQRRLRDRLEQKAVDPGGGCGRLRLSLPKGSSGSRPAPRAGRWPTVCSKPGRRSDPPWSSRQHQLVGFARRVGNTHLHQRLATDEAQSTRTAGPANRPPIRLSQHALVNDRIRAPLKATDRPACSGCRATQGAG